MSRFFLLCIGTLFLFAAPARAQTTVSVIGAVTPGDCASFNSTTIIKDAGTTCGGGGGGSPGGSNGQIQFNSSGSFGGFTMGGDCTVTTSTGIEICTKTNGVAFGTFATQNFASPPAIGGIAPAAGTFTTLIATSTTTSSLTTATLSATTSMTSPSVTDSSITGSTQCVQANSSGLLSGQGVPCPPLVDPKAGRFVPLITGTVSSVSCSATSPFNCLQFCQYRGNQILVNGAYVAIPSGGCVGATGGIMAAVTAACIENAIFVTTCAQTLASNTLYYVYVGLVTGTPTMIFSPNVYNVYSSANGNAVMNGDATRSLIGLIQTQPAAATVAGNANQQNSVSWFNKIFDGLQAVPTGSFSAASYTNIGTCSGGVFSNCMTWVQFSDDVPTIHLDCVLNTGSSSVSASIGIGISTTGTPATLPSAFTTINATTSLSQSSQSSTGAIGSEGYVIANTLGLSNGSVSVSVTSCDIGLPSRMPS